MLTILAFSLLLDAPPAQAGSYTDTQSGGAAPTVNPAADTQSTEPHEATASASMSPRGGSGISPYTIQANPGAAPLTDTFTWAADPTIPNDQPPPCVIVEQTSSATWYVQNEGGSGTGSGTGNCGLPSGATVTSSTYGQANGPSQSLSATYYSGQTSPGASFAVSCSPAASFTGQTGSAGSVEGEAMVVDEAFAYPVTLTVGGTTLDASGNWNILVGQQCTASLVVSSDHSGQTCFCTLSNFRWNVSGTTFESWRPTTPAFPNASPPTQANSNASYYNPGPIPATQSTSWYWNDPSSTTETISCTVTVTPPAGEGSPFDLTVTAPKPVSVQLPGWFAYEAGGYMQVSTTAPNTNNAITLNAGPGQSGGVTWTANVMGSALFASGTIELVQLVTPDESYVTYTGVGVPGVTHNDPENGKFGLDTAYPYA